MKNIQVVDGIVKETEKLFSDFFKDQKTAYVFTADHGMSNIGNHGDGSASRTTAFFETDSIFLQILTVQEHPS